MCHLSVELDQFVEYPKFDIFIELHFSYTVCLDKKSVSIFTHKVHIWYLVSHVARESGKERWI